jgi:FMN-dependent NADH-azoreductase
MSTLLKIDVSPRGDYSVSRKLSAEYAAQWQAAHPDGKVVVRDLVKTDLPFVDMPWIAAAYSTPDQHTPEHAAAIKISNVLTAELLAADHIVLATPMYNFNVPAALKAYIDHIVRIGVTVSTSYEGLAKNKKLTILIASGSDYAPGSHMESYDAETGYLKQVFGFIGITDVTVVKAGGVSAVMQGKVPIEEFIVPFEKQIAALEK